ncbi:MAG: TlpA disulfide reductase family protein [Acidobacteriota bacterium]
MGRSTAVVLLWIASAIILSLTTATEAATADDDRPPAERTKARDVWTELEMIDLKGERWTGDRLRGHVVLLDFWATWCAPCLAEIPTLRRLHHDLAPRGLVLLGVAIERTSRRELQSFLDRHDMAWPQVLDRRGFGAPLPKRFGVEAVPRTVLIDRGGRMVAVDLRGEALATAARDLVSPPIENERPTSQAR